MEKIRGIILILIIFFSCSSQKNGGTDSNGNSNGNSTAQQLSKFSRESLLAELNARNPSVEKELDTIPKNDSLLLFEDKDLFSALIQMERVIYGTDDRYEAATVNDPAISKNTKTVVGFFKREDLNIGPDSSVSLKSNLTFRERLSL